MALVIIFSLKIINNIIICEEKMKKFFLEFKDFIGKSNVIDMAVGVVIGKAFGDIVNSIVNGILVPIIGKLVGGFDVSQWKWVLTAASVDASGNAVPEVAIAYGSVIQSVLNFLIIALCIFSVIKTITKAKYSADKLLKIEKKKEDFNETELDVLRDIRESLNKSKR
jgi:large conductance mechanosensitive channel